VITDTFTFSPVNASFIRDGSNYLVDFDSPEKITEIIRNINTRRLVEIQNKTGIPLPTDKFALEATIHAVQNVKNETISERRLYEYGELS
jgi:hypothetical protein